MTGRLRWTLAAGLALALYAFVLLSIGLTRDWQLRHEDNGAMHTTLALSHLRLGIGRTHAHDVFFNPHTGELVPYGHHPPATALVVAGAFALTGSDSPAVARLAVICFQIGSVLLLTGLLREFFTPSKALIGGFIMATLPMSTYYGRMVNYEPLCLFAVVLQLFGYVRYKLHRPGGLAMLVAGIVIGGFIDWPAFFFAAALAIVEAVDWIRSSAPEAPDWRGLIVLGASAPIVFAIDVWHMWYAGAGGISALQSVAASNRPLWDQDFTVVRFLLAQLDTFRSYFTEAGLIATALAWWCLAMPHRPLSRRLFDVPHAAALTRAIVAGSAAATAYVIAAPSWAMAHQYWQFYFLPIVAISMVTCYSCLEREIRERRSLVPRALLVICVLDILAASAFRLHFRHTRPEAYAIETTAMFRSTFLAPERAEPDGR
jgi:4-amino-4-deoxy-L-arabinose transferase-like glycosyltransferase